MNEINNNLFENKFEIKEESNIFADIYDSEELLFPLDSSSGEKSGIKR